MENTAIETQPLGHKTTTAVADSLQPSSFLEPTVATVRSKKPGILATCKLPLLRSDDSLERPPSLHRCRRSEATGQAVESNLHQTTSTFEPIVSTKQSDHEKIRKDQCFIQSTAGSLVRENDIDSISSSNVSKVDQGTKIEPPSLKRVASEYPSSSYSPEEEDASVALAGPPPKRKDRQAPPAQVLAEELLATGAERLKRHILTFAQRAHTFPEAFDEHGDWTKQVCDILNLAKEWDEKSEFSKLVGLILRTHGVELINAAARSMLKLDEEAPDPLVPRAIIDRIFPYVRSERTPASFRSWLTQTRRLLRIKDFLPFMPFGSSDMATFRDYERSTNQDIEQLCNILKNDPRAQQMAQAGWAFGDCILQRRAYLWVSFSPEELSELPEETLLHVVTIRSDPTGRTCGVCKGGKCDLLHFCPALASKQQSSAACDGDDDSQPAPQELMGKYCKDMIPSSAPISLQGIERGADALLPAASKLQSQKHTWPIFSAAKQQNITCQRPQLQLVLPRKISDTAESIHFCIKGDIGSLQRLFSRGLASPRDESHSRGFSLLRVSYTHPLHQKQFYSSKVAKIP